EGGDRERLEVAARDEVQEREDVALTEGARAQRLDVHARSRDVDHQAVDGEQPDGDEQLGPQVRDDQSIAKGLQHAYAPSAVVGSSVAPETSGRTTVPPAAATASTATREAASTVTTRFLTSRAPSASNFTG